MTDYQKAVEKHMATAPQPLAEYVRERLGSSDGWIEGYRPIQCCGFDWHGSVEGYSFWIRVDMKNWTKAMATDFWKKHTAPTESTSIEFVKPEHPEEYDFVNPAHYQEFSVEVIDMMAAIWGKETAATHCEMCAFKYRMRLGSKPNQSIEDELGKINWYMEKAKELRG